MNLFALAATITLIHSQGLVNDIPKKYLNPAPAPSKVVAKVNGAEIKASDVEDLLWQWRGAEVTSEIISYLLVKAEALKQNVAVTDQEVEDLLDTQIKQVAGQVPQGRTIDDVLMEQGFTRSRLFQRDKTELLINKLVAKDMKPDTWVKVSTIVVKAESASAEAVSGAAKKAQGLYDRLKKGESWDSVLNAATQDPKIQQSKGLIGWRQLDVFPESSRQELAGMKAGQISKPVQTTNGFQIFRVEATGSSAKGPDLEELKGSYIQMNRPQYLNKLRASAKIERFLP